MSFFRALLAGVRRLLHTDRANRDLDDELDAFAAEATAEYLRRGLTREQARRQVAIDMGSRAAARDEVRHGGWEHVVDATSRDLRLAIRALRRTPGFAVVAVLTLAIGIGATTAIFSVVDPLLVRPLPYPGAGSLVLIADRTSDDGSMPTAYGTFRELLERSHAFARLSTTDNWQPVLGDGVEPVRIDGQFVTSEYFRTLGVSPAIGRDFTKDDERIGAPRVAILSDAAVERRFGGDQTVLGRSITLSGFSVTVIGIMPRGFVAATAPTAEIWSPARYQWPASLQGPE